MYLAVRCSGAKVMDKHTRQANKHQIGEKGENPPAQRTEHCSPDLL